jgi:hypothetical protein
MTPTPVRGKIPLKIFRILLSIFLLGLLAITAAFAFNWRYYHDAPIFFYISLLIDKFGLIPYRDIFEYNMPGTYFADLIVGRLTGFSVLGVRILDYILLAVYVFLGWLWMRKLSGWAGFFGGIAWALAYLALGPTAMMQREYMMMLPILCGLAAYTNIPPERNRLRFLLTGLFLGMSSTLKPQAFIGLLPVLVMEGISINAEFIASRRQKIAAYLRRIVLWLAVGFLIPWMIIFIYLGIHGALPQFLDIVFNYLPLFAQMNGNHVVVSGLRRIYTLIMDYAKLGSYGIWIAPALLGAYLLRQSPDIPPEKKRHGALLLLFVLAYSIYPVFSGQFFPQHWFPFTFVLFQAAFVCLAMNAQEGNALFRWLPAGVLLIASLSLVRPDTLDNLRLLVVEHALPAANDPKEGRVDEIAAFLEANLHPGDMVQPLDWVGGAVHAMLIARVKIATPFIYDEYFYHHLNLPYVQELRQRFVDDLQRALPRFVVEVYDDGPYAEPTGPNTSRDFPELRAFLAENYSVVREGQGYRIYELHAK